MSLAGVARHRPEARRLIDARRRSSVGLGQAGRPPQDADSGPQIGKQAERRHGREVLGGRHDCDGELVENLWSCSTPFGITEVGTTSSGRSARPAGGAQCLSASRRSAPRGRPTSRCRCSCAQRLSASRRSALGTEEGKTFRTGAQRLSASRRSAPDRTRPLFFRGSVLNAFRHHGGRHVGGRPRALDQGRVLNAFRHHGGRHLAGPVGLRGPDPIVLNAFRHHGGRHRRRVEPGEAAVQVLNAFRHHGGRHVPDAGDVLGWLNCSTPFGITEVGTTARPTATPTGPRSAQRLSASRRSAHRGRTPTRTRRSSAQRLSASRRSAPPRASGSCSGSNLLNAFRHHGGRHEPVIRLVRGYELCSTPFGITEVGTRVGPLHARVHELLNAFRHHGGRHLLDAYFPSVVSNCSTPFGITEVGTFAPLVPFRCNLLLLNAFRHHGGRHPTPWSCFYVNHCCSTPFGITEVGTRAVAFGPRPPCLLNAFRHHGGRHRPGVLVSLGEVVCSTPFGITEVGTRVPDVRGGRAAVCSTPFGITEVGTRHVGRERRPLRGLLNAFRHHGGRHWPCGKSSPAGRQLLNAFRHHGGRHTGSGPATAGIGTAAQRLSASRRSARKLAARVDCACGAAQRLSASRRSAQRQAGAGDERLDCSTPFGITEVGTRRCRPPSRSRGTAQRLSASRRSARRQRRGEPLVELLLNAFRHHGGRHRPIGRKDRVRGGCSTPFGITEVGTRGVPEPPARRAACSTPFGITEVGTRP